MQLFMVWVLLHFCSHSCWKACGSRWLHPTTMGPPCSSCYTHQRRRRCPWGLRVTTTGGPYTSMTLQQQLPLLLDSLLSQPPDFDSLRNVCSRLGHLKNKASCCQWQYTSSFYPSSVGTSGWRSLHVPAWITCRLRRGRRERGKINVKTWQLHFCLSATVKI